MGNEFEMVLTAVRQCECVYYNQTVHLNIAMMAVLVRFPSL